MQRQQTARALLSHKRTSPHCSQRALQSLLPKPHGALGQEGEKAILQLVPSEYEDSAGRGRPCRLQQKLKAARVVVAYASRAVDVHLSAPAKPL